VEFDVRHRAAQLQHGAGHVVVGGDDDQAVEAHRLRPLLGLARIADRVGRVEPEVNAAVIEPAHRTADGADVLAGGFAVDA
jgi:hypothetical protein